jgi:hypothetical protein
MRWPCFLIEETETVHRYISIGENTYRTTGQKCTDGSTYHNAGNYLLDGKLAITGEDSLRGDVLNPFIPSDEEMHQGAFTHCHCGFAFTDKSYSSAYAGRNWKRSDGTGPEHVNQGDFGIGAMYRAYWYKREDGTYSHYWDNQYEADLIVITPGGDWNIDSRASNCTLHSDRTHRCWVRVGVPPLISVGKGGVSCAAGAGSIRAGHWHGYLGRKTPGFLEDDYE